MPFAMGRVMMKSVCRRGFSNITSGHSAFHHLFANRTLLLVLAMVLVGQWIIVTFGGQMFRTVPLSAAEWGWIILLTSPVLWIGEIVRLFKGKRNK